MPLLWRIILTMTFLIVGGCASLQSGDGLGYFKSSAERLESDPLTATPSVPGDSHVDDVYMQSKADYHFTLAESYSLQDQPEKSIENYKLALVYDQKSAQIRYRLGLEYVKLGLVSEAITQCKEALNRHPEHKDSALLLGGLYSALHLYDQAKLEYQRVLKHHPEDVEAALFIGALYAEQKQFSKATSYLLKLARRKNISDKSQIWYYLGRIYGSQDPADFKNAESAFVTAIKLRSGYLEAVLSLGALYEQKELPNRAMQTYLNFQEEFGPNPVLAERLAQIYLDKDQLDKAYTQLEIMESFDEGPGIRFKMALILIEQGQSDKAVQKLEAIVARWPNSPEIRFNLGALYEKMKNYRAAIQQFQTVRFGNEFFEDAILHASYLYKLEGNFSGAIGEVDRGLSHDDDNAKYWLLKASLLDENEKTGEAKDLLEKAIVKFPSNPHINFQLGSVYDRLGRRDKTVIFMEKVISIDENHIEALNYLAYVYAESTRNLQAAEQLARKALGLKPGDGYILDTLGWVLYKQDRLVEAVATLEKAHGKESKESIIAEHLGDAYFRYKLHNKARSMYQKAALLEKNDSKRIKIEAKLKSIESKLTAERGQKLRTPAAK